eukprot:PITA_02191
MTDIGHLHYFLSLQVFQSKEGISLSHSKYACDLLRQFHMEYYKPSPSPFQFGAKLLVTYTSPNVDATLYLQLVGKLLYLTHTRPDLSFDVGLIAQFMQNPHEIHWKEAKRILSYVRGYVFTLGSGPITWAFKKQSIVASLKLVRKPCGFVRSRQSWVFSNIIQLHFGVIIKVPFNYAKIQSNISATNTLNYTCTSSESSFILEVQYCSTDDQVADILTKALTQAKFTKLRFMVGV